MQPIKALFLDRDGTIIYDELGGYIKSIEQVRFVPAQSEHWQPPKKQATSWSWLQTKQA